MDGYNGALFNACNPTTVSDVPLQWLQSPPVQLPWVLPTNQYPDIVQFSAHQPVMPDGFSAENFAFQHNYSPPQNCKRKSDMTEDVPCPKKLITEEKISGLLKGMHITKTGATELGKEKSSNVADLLEAGTSSECPKQQLKRLVLCEEIRQFKSDPILPSALLSKLSSASMSLVLWKPPAGHLSEMLKQAANNASTSHDSVMRMDMEAEDEPNASTSEMQ